MKRRLKTVFREQTKRRYKIALYLFAGCWMLTSLLLFFGEQDKESKFNKKPYLSSMSNEETNWERIYTGADFATSLLKAEIENMGVETRISSNKDAGLHAGFGASGFAQLFVKAEDKSKVLEVVEQFEAKMK